MSLTAMKNQLTYSLCFSSQLQNQVEQVESFWNISSLHTFMTVYCHFMIMVVGNQLELACTDQTAQTHSAPGGSTCKHCHSSPLLVQSTHSWLVFKQQSMRLLSAGRLLENPTMQGSAGSLEQQQDDETPPGSGFSKDGCWIWHGVGGAAEKKKHKECLVFSGQLRRARGVLSLESELNSTGLSRGDKKNPPKSNWDLMVETRNHYREPLRTRPVRRNPLLELLDGDQWRGMNFGPICKPLDRTAPTLTLSQS